MVACTQTGNLVEQHFADASKSSPMPHGGVREVKNSIDFKNIQTDAKLKRDQITEEDAAINTHHFVGDQVRKAIEAIHAPMPEMLPSAPSIRKLVEERRRAAKKRRLNADKQSGQGSLVTDQNNNTTDQ